MVRRRGDATRRPTDLWWGKFWARCLHCSSPKGVKDGSYIFRSQHCLLKGSLSRKTGFRITPEISFIADDLRYEWKEKGSGKYTYRHALISHTEVVIPLGMSDAVDYRCHGEGCNRFWLSRKYLVKDRWGREDLSDLSRERSEVYSKNVFRRNHAGRTKEMRLHAPLSHSSFVQNFCPWVYCRSLEAGSSAYLPLLGVGKIIRVVGRCR